MMEIKDNIILGAGFAGLGAAYKLYKQGREALIVEKEQSYGGLSGCFEINGFRFDKFIHLACTTNEQVLDIYNQSCPDSILHHPTPYNIYNRQWIKHPAQNNLYPLDECIKKAIVEDFQSRPKIDETVKVHNYEEWLRFTFGNYFAEHFPMVYTRKYWRREAKELRTEWIGSRIYQPSVDEVIFGCENPPQKTPYYLGKMRYPKNGGYKTFVKSIVEKADIRYNYELVKINHAQKVLTFANGKKIQYNKLYSSIPLTEIVRMVDNIPQLVIEAANKLEYTSGYHVSIALKTKNIPPYLWWYIYDEDVLASRVYSPSMKSEDNAPKGCSSLQMEVYCQKDEYTEQELLDGTVGKLIELSIIKKEDILFTHIGFEKYANIVFSHPVYESRKIVRDWLESVGISTIGRFGEWEYLWSDQSLLSGLQCK